MEGSNEPQVASKSSNSVTIVVAVIGAAAVLFSAVLGNWDKIVPGKQPLPPDKAVAANANTMVPPFSGQTTSGDQSAAIGSVGRDLTINYGAASERRRLTPAQRAHIDGLWRTEMFETGSGPERLTLTFKTTADGQVLGSVKVSDNNGDFGTEYGLTNGKTDGSSIAMTFSSGGKLRDQSGELTIPVMESLQGEFSGDELQLSYQFSDIAPVSTTARRITAER